MIFYTIGQMLKLVGLAIFVPMVVAVIYSENVLPYILVIGIFEIIGFAMAFKRPKDSVIYSKEATVSIALAWIMISLLGALLYVISGAIPFYTDAVFEMVSGITTTGSSILQVVDVLPKGILFFRNFTNFLGGVGILVFILALSTNGSANGIFLLKAESSGPNVGKMTNKLRNTAIITYLIYFALTFLCIISLLIAGLDLFNASVVAFSTAGTGGFAPTNSSILSYNSLPVEIVLSIFMFIFSINFTIYFLILTGKILSALRNEELWTFVIIFIGAIALVSINIMPVYGNFLTALRYASFEVSTSISTCGYGIADISLWPSFSQMLLLLLMVMGGCAGSTAGGLKVSRCVGLVKASGQKIIQVTNPRKVLNVKIDGKVQDDNYINSLYFYFSIYIAILFASTLLACLDPALDIQTALSATICTFNNAGPGIGIIGPIGNFSSLGWATKWLLSILMLLGRLEIFPLLIIFMPSTWRKKKKSLRVERA